LDLIAKQSDGSRSTKTNIILSVLYGEGSLGEGKL